MQWIECAPPRCGTNEVIERTTQLDRYVTTLDRRLREPETRLARFRRETDKTVEVLNNLRGDIGTVKKQAAKFRSEQNGTETHISMPLPVHRWFFPVVFTALILWAPCASFVREAGDRLRIIFFG